MMLSLILLRHNQFARPQIAKIKQLWITKM